MFFENAVDSILKRRVILERDSDRIIEIATLVTDGDLNTLAEGPVMVVHQADGLLDGMDDWNTRQHGGSGLTERVRASIVSEADAEDRTLEFLARWVPSGASPMCGNSICLDRRFLHRGMPRLEEWFHYRNLDVSSLKELCRRWAPEIAAGVSKRAAHRALDDIEDSVSELRHYREHFLRLPPGAGR